MFAPLIGALGQTGAASVIGSGISAVGGLIGNIFSGSSAKKRAREQMAFQERMANTQHQRQVKDLRAAGLNPILSANRGAAAPTGAMAPTPDYGSTVQGGLMNMVNTAISAKQLEEQIQMNRTIKGLNISKAAEADASAIAKHAQAGLYTDQALREMAQKNLYKSQNEMLQRDLEFLKSISPEAGGSSTINQILRGVETFGRLLK